MDSKFYRYIENNLNEGDLYYTEDKVNEVYEDDEIDRYLMDGDGDSKFRPSGFTDNKEIFTHFAEMFGKKTILDNIEFDTTKEKEIILNAIKDKSFVFEIFKERYIKRGKKSRKINIVAPKNKHIDRLVFRYLSSLYNTPHSSSIYKITLSISMYLQPGNAFALRVDVKDFFDSIKHNILIEILKKENDELLLSFIEAFLKTKRQTNTKRDGNKVDCGVPQGCAISQALSNIYLRHLDDLLIKHAHENDDLYFRYTDDFCYLSTDKTRINAVEDIISTELKMLGLTINIDKLVKSDLNSSFDYLGFTHTPQGIKLSNKSLTLIKGSYYKTYNEYCNDNNYYMYNKIKINNLFWSKLSQRINCSIRGFNKSWFMEYTDSGVYGLARHLSIIQDVEQIKELQKWISNINKYYCYKICKERKIGKTFIEIESLVNWYYRYKKNYCNAINLAYKKYLENKAPLPGYANRDLLDVQYIQDHTKDQFGTRRNDEDDSGNSNVENENEYISIRGHDMIVCDDMYYDDISENWEPIPDDFKIS
ncbi:MAG: group II intron reverse transcriptase domain-containing protein [Chitinophagaceae bacterium]|nr:group II intron reverse transcriptase domain-containing protein [Chitinophagaceae bacterium]